VLEEMENILGTVNGIGIEARNATEILVRKPEPTEWKDLFT
jgi:hypothetical protein